MYSFNVARYVAIPPPPISGTPYEDLIPLGYLQTLVEVGLFIPMVRAYYRSDSEILNSGSNLLQIIS